MASQHQMTCRGLRIFVLLCGLCLIIPILLTYSVVTVREAPNFTWNANSTRDLAIYVQPENVTAIISNADLCLTEDDKPLLLIIVCSAVDNFQAREAIRQTWMSFNESAPFHIKTAFLLGQTVNDTRQNDVLNESNLHGDIIQEGFLDAYLNLTLKTVMMLKWVTIHCPQVTFVLKTDDDMYVNIGALSNYLSQSDVIHRKDLIVGSLFCRVTPIKDLGSKWYSPQFMYNGKEYPDYVSGTGYVISGRLVSKLFNNALRVPLFHLEDVFLTGMVARQSNIVPENYHLFSYGKHPLGNVCLYRKIITSHGLSARDLRQVWHLVTNPRFDCSTVQLPKIGDHKLKKCRKPKRVAIRRG